jgi:hypothetical protein
MARGAADGSYWFTRKRAPSRSALSRPDVRDVTVYIYGLAGADGRIRYVGKSNAPRARLNSHRHTTGAPLVRHWLLSLDASGEEVQIFVLDEVPAGTDAAPFEARAIRKHDTGGLLNVRGTGRRGVCRFCLSTQHYGQKCRKVA